MLSAKHIFAVDGEKYGWCDIVVAAARNGAWAAAERRARLGAASVEHAAATEDVLAPGALDAAARDFRYARDLITRESMEQWLVKLGLSHNDWTTYLRRDLNRARWPADADALLQRYPISDEQAARLTLIDVMCSGELGEWMQSLGRRAAAASSLDSAAPVRRRGEVAPPELLRPALPLFGASIENLRESTQRVQALDDAFERFRETQVTDAAVRDYVGRRQIDWVQFDCRMMVFPEQDMAAEAALLLREDGEGFTGVYAVAHAEPRVAHFFLDHIAGPARNEFLAAKTGDLVGPVRVGDEYALYLIQEKVLPSPRDPEVRRRAEEGVLENALRQQFDQRVRWLADSR
ncbi:MAG: hypothetical protein ABJE10_10695 [bacterium]